MDYVYDLFLDRVASGRSLEKAQVNEVGRGRVWTGAQAQRERAGRRARRVPQRHQRRQEGGGDPHRGAGRAELLSAARRWPQRLAKMLGTRIASAAPLWWQQIERATAAWQFPAGSILTLMPQDISIR